MQLNKISNSINRFPYLAIVINVIRNAKEFIIRILCILLWNLLCKCIEVNKYSFRYFIIFSLNEDNDKYYRRDIKKIVISPLEEYFIHYVMVFLIENVILLINISQHILKFIMCSLKTNILTFNAKHL